MSTSIDDYAVEQAVFRYATALDTRDWGLLESVLAPEIVFTPDGFEPLVGFETIRDTVANALEGQLSQHYLMSVVPEINGDTATCTSYLQAQHIREGTPGGSTLIVAGIYRDTLQRTPEGWKFSVRTLSVLWTRGNPDVPLGKVAGS